ncbi:hypothetical protein OIU54_26855, partial [Citrobacter freundii]|nr:hypothetical protein [Citrobacter freundii]
MTIINATQYLKQLLSSSELNRIGKFTGFCQRLRDIQPARLLPALLSGLGCDKVDGIAGLHRHFNALQLHDTDQIAYKPFHCSGQLKLATALEFFQYRFSDSFGGNP